MTLNDIRKAISNIVYPSKNAMTLPGRFLRQGNRTSPIDANWSDVVISDEDIYSGYFYAAIKKRANAVARIAIENVRTLTANEDEEFEHPYLTILSESKTFSDYAFWHDISTYLDLEGVYYLMAVRAVDGERVGDIQEFKLLNPYNIRKVRNADSWEVGGYVETRDGFIRDIPKEMIIPIYELNPFKPGEPYAMTDAAKGSQFTIKTAEDYTRKSLRNNINAPGLLSTEVILPDEEFTNFVSRVKNHVEGEPIFGNGSGSLTWESMQTELSKAALRDVHEINRDTLFAASGVGKTIMGIEQSGTTRETARVQKDLHMEGETLPRIQLILDSLNQDYKNNYESDYKRTKAELVVDNPLATDHEADLKEGEVKQKQFELYQSLINTGFEPSLAAQYVLGQVDIDRLGEPTRKPIVVALPIAQPEEEEEEEEQEQTIGGKVVNQVEDEKKGIIRQQEGALKNAIINVEEQIVASSMKRIAAKVKNQFEDEADILTKKEKSGFINELEIILASFYGVVLSLSGGETMRDRIGTYSLPGTFAFDREVRSYIKEMASKVSVSHVETVLRDILVTAREAALEGLSLPQIETRIREKYSGQIAKTRAETIARTETNRAFTRAQYEADRQFIEQNDLEGRVYKRWRTRSDNPCPFCQALEREGEVPFGNAFRSLGESVSVGKGEDKKTLDVKFEPLEAGNAHPNCSCIYELIIR